jgi:glutamine synthetase
VSESIMHFAPRAGHPFSGRQPRYRLIELFILDANGVPRGKLLHRDELLAVYESGRPLPSTILGLTLNGDDVENSGLVWDVGDIDCRAYPLEGSLVRLPWRRMPTAAVQVSMHPSEGMPASIADPRHVLLRTIEALKADGYHPVMACELEFYLLDQQRDAQGRPQPALDNDGGRPRRPRSMACANWSRSNRSSPTSMPPARPGHSGAHGDFRIRPGPGGNHPGTRRRAAGDGPGRALQAPGQRRGPSPRHAGLLHGQAVRRTGRHRHAHAREPGRREGNNLFASEDPAGTPLLRQAVAACSPPARLAAAVLPQRQLLPPLPGQQLCAAGADLGRRQPHRQPARAGRPGQQPACRTPHLRRRRQPYLAAAAILAAIHRGIREQLDPGAPVEGNGYAQATEHLPTDWLTALDALERSHWAREALGEDFLGVYLKVKRAEYRQFMAEVGEQDWRWYLHQA